MKPTVQWARYYIELYELRRYELEERTDDTANLATKLYELAKAILAESEQDNE